jgi:hypothetical protein
MPTYELKDQTTGFYDPETGLKIVRDQQVETGRVGIATAIAIKSGRLLAVATKPRRGARATKPEDGTGQDGAR